MRLNLENHIMDLIEQISVFRSRQCEIIRIDQRISDLRCKYTRNKEQIRKFEAKLSIADDIGNFGEMERFTAILDILREREAEIAYAGKTYKTERDELIKGIADLQKLQNDLVKSEVKLKAGIENEVSCNVGSKCLRVAEFLYNSKTCSEVFYPIVGDWREEYTTALRKGRVFDAIFISIKNYISFIQTMIICSKFGKAIEFIMKLADVIEFFNKFSK